MNISSIRHPENSTYIELHEWMKSICRGNPCAAMLLGIFSSWHKYRMRNDVLYQRYTKRNHSELQICSDNKKAYLFFTLEELMAELMGLFQKSDINQALQVLESLGIISIYRNPNERYYFDKTKYFVFHEDVCEQWNKHISTNNRKEHQV
jgi:hypothetical protein